MTTLFEICLMALETGIPQFHESGCTTTVTVEEATILLLNCMSASMGKRRHLCAFFHWSEHMIVTEGHVWTAGGMWKNFPPKLLQLLTSGSSRIGSGIVMEENDTTR